MAESRITTAFQNLDASPFNGFMTARLLIPIETTADAQSYVPQEFDFQVVAGQAYNDYATAEIATLPHTSSGACNPGNTPISIYLKGSSGQKTYYKSVIIPPETGGVPVVLTSLVAVEPDSEVAYTNVTNLTPRGVYDAGTAYVLGDTVTHAGSTYWANQTSTGQTPSAVSTYWNQLIEGIEPTLASTTAASAAALGDLFHTVQSGPVIRKVTNQQVFNLLDDQALTWTAAQTFGATPAVFTGVTAVGINKEHASTTSIRPAFVSENVANPAASSAASSVGVVGYAESKAGNAQNFTGTGSSTGVVGVRGQVSHKGSGVMSSAFGLYAGIAANTGGGTITNNYGVYIDAQTAGATNWGIYQAGTAKNRLSGITGIGMDPVNTLDVAGTFAATGKSYIEAAPTTSSAYAFGVRSEKTATAYGTVFEIVGNPVSTASNVWFGVYGKAETKAGNTFGSSNSLALRGLSGVAEHAGTGTVTGAVSVSAGVVSNSGGGTITNVYGVHIAAQSAGTNNFGLYQAGTTDKNYFGSNVGIGTITPAYPLTVFGPTVAQIGFGEAAATGTIYAELGGANFAYLTGWDGTNHTANSSSAGAVYRQSSGSHAWYATAAGLSLGDVQTLTQQASLTTVGTVTSFWVAGNATMLGSHSAAIGAAPIYTATTNTRIAGKFEAMSNPTADGTQVIIGALGNASSVAGNAFNFTSSVSALRGGYFRCYHKGSGVITGMAAITAESPVNDGGGTVTTNYGVYIAAQTAAGITSGWGVYQVGSSTNNYFAGDVGIGGLPSGTYPLEVTGTSYFSGDATFAGGHGAVTVGTTTDAVTAAFISAKNTSAYTTGSSAGTGSQIVANPPSTSSASFTGVLGASETDAACSQNLTNPFGLRGLFATVTHAGGGIVTGAVGVYVPGITKTGGGSITNSYGVYIAAQTSAASNWGVYQAGTESNYFGGDVTINTAGKGIRIKEGANAKMGQATLVGGTVTVANTSVTAASRIFFQRATGGGTRGELEYTQINGTSFTIRSVDSAGNLVADTSVINWEIKEAL